MQKKQANQPTQQNNAKKNGIGRMFKSKRARVVLKTPGAGGLLKSAEADAQQREGLT